MKNKTLKILFISFLLATCFQTAAFSWERLGVEVFGIGLFEARWLFNSSKELSVDQSVVSRSLYDPFVSAVNNWNDVRGSSFHMDTHQATYCGPGWDSINCISMVPLPSFVGGATIPSFFSSMGIPPVAHVFSVDITLNSTLNWEREELTRDVIESHPTVTREKMNFKNVSQHELGHFVMLGHNYTLSTMTTHYSDGMYDLKGDDMFGIRSMYPDGNFPEYDLSLTHYKVHHWLGPPERSQLVRVPSPSPERLFTGDPVTFSFTAENRGADVGFPVSLAYFLSKDKVIDPQEDRELAMRDLSTFPQGGHVVFSETVPIPEDLATGGTHYIGVIIDYGSQLTEFDEDNNYLTIAKPIEILTKINLIDGNYNAESGASIELRSSATGELVERVRTQFAGGINPPQIAEFVIEEPCTYKIFPYRFYQIAEGTINPGDRAVIELDKERYAYIHSSMASGPVDAQIQVWDCSGDLVASGSGSDFSFYTGGGCFWEGFSYTATYNEISRSGVVYSAEHEDVVFTKKTQPWTPPINLQGPDGDPEPGGMGGLF
ncbi:matrixin family metalloprotease [Candidatus Omnitrophota bacterium]